MPLASGIISMIPRSDFVVILAPTAWLLRPVTPKATAFVVDAYASAKRGIFETLIFDSAGAFHAALEKLSNAGLRVEIL